jgi:3-oxoacyl-[acyl-carrier-protein] synthase II
MFIKAASTISYQPTFQKPGFSMEIDPINSSSKLFAPDYSAFISAMDRRRMTQVQKTSITCAMDCLQQAGIDQPNAIIVGTSMGCSINIKNFLDKICEAKEGPLSPTSFIVSTHNTVAGQIGLLLKNHGYNMTYTQNTLSFEQAMVDAILCCNEGLSNVLVGGADEEEESIYNTRGRLNNETVILTSGASFFVVSNLNKNDPVRVLDVATFGLVKDTQEVVKKFLKANNLSIDEIDLVLFAINNEGNGGNLPFPPGKLLDYQQLAGTYYTNSAFALHYAFDVLTVNRHRTSRDLKTIMIYNNLVPENLGLMLLTSDSK